MSVLFKGAPVASAITEQLQKQVEILKTRNIVPTLAMVRVGNKEDDLTYQRSIEKRFEKLGVKTLLFELNENCTKEELCAVIQKINSDSLIHGCLLFRPLKDKEMEEAVSSLLEPKKDVDSMTPSSFNHLITQSGDGFHPCTAEAVIECLKYYQVELANKNVVVLGRSQVIGQPVALLLQKENAQVTVCHSQTLNTEDVASKADILISAMGKAKKVDHRYTNPEQIIVDVGINQDENGNLCGDVDFNDVESKVAAITPVPGGIGSITTTILAKHVVQAAEFSL